MTPNPARIVLPLMVVGLPAVLVQAGVTEDAKAVLADWGRAGTSSDRNADGTVDTRDLVLALMGKNALPGASIVGTSPAHGGTSFIGVECLGVVQPGWGDNGYDGLDTYRVYALFDESGPGHGVIAVFGVQDQPLIIDSSSGAFHNDTVADRLTAPEDLRDAGVWSNQWDTYVTITATDAADDTLLLSPNFGEVTNNLRSGFNDDNIGWFVFPEATQAQAVNGQVLLGQFSVEAGIDVFGSLNLLLLDGQVPIDLKFFCLGGGGGSAEFGACCIDSGAICRMTSEAACVNLFGGVFGGIGTECQRQVVDTPCHPGASGQHCVRVVATCPEPGAAHGECEPGLLLDAWVSPEQGDAGDQETWHDFGAAGQSIPADFFAFGSDPLTDVVTLKSVPIGDEFGDADTLIRRSADPFDRCAVPSEEEVAVEAEVLILSLESAAPVRVTYLGGQYEQFWDVSVALSLAPPDPGTLRAKKTTCNGGTYTIENLRVRPRFTFTRVAYPEDRRVFDTGAHGLDPVVFSLEDGHWVSDVDPGFMTLNPYCTDFRAGLVDLAPPANCDCNGNALRDLCDIEAGESLDCNADAVPDECEIAEGAADCNKNGVLDWCECPGDVVGNCNVGFADMLAVIAGWGPCESCPQDVTRDGDVGYADVLEILRTWGPCGQE